MYKRKTLFLQLQSVPKLGMLITQCLDLIFKPSKVTRTGNTMFAVTAIIFALQKKAQNSGRNSSQSHKHQTDNMTGDVPRRIF